MTTFEASMVTYDENRSTLFEIGNYNSSIGEMATFLYAEDKTGKLAGICGTFGFQFSLNTIIIGLLCILGLAGNTISIVVLQKDQHNRVAVFLLQSLAIADNSFLCLAFIILSIMYGLHDVLNDARLLNYAFIALKYLNTLGNIAMSVGTWLTVLLAVNRYIAICRPFKAKRWLTMACARVQVAVVVAIFVPLNVPMILRFGDTPCANSSSNCSEVAHSDLGKTRSFGLYYLHAFYLPFVFILPLVLLVGLNVPIIRQMRQSRLRMKRDSLSYSGRQEANITIVLVAIILVMVVCHTPDRIVQIVRAYDLVVLGKPTPKCPEPMYFALNLTNLFMIVNCATDFIVYYVLRRRFRRILCQKLCCGRGSNHVGPDESPPPSLANGGLYYHSQSLRHHSHHNCGRRKSSAEVDAKAMTFTERYRLTKKRDSNQMCLLKVNNTCM